MKAVLVLNHRVSFGRLFCLVRIYCGIFIPQLVLKDISAHTVHGNVHLTVNLTHVDIKMDHVVVLQVGWVIIVLQVMLLKSIF